MRLSRGAAVTEAALDEAGRSQRGRRVQTHIQGSVGFTALRHAHSACACDGQKPQLCQPNIQSGLSHPDTDPASQYDFRRLSFPAATQAAFLKAYARAHPRSGTGSLKRRASGRITLHVPDFGNSKRNGNSTR
jgi:hypothetical protein